MLYPYHRLCEAHTASIFLFEVRNMSNAASSAMQNEIPIFFSTDDNYIPYLDIAIASLIANASKQYNYRIIILHTGLEAENIRLILKNRCSGFAIEFADLSEEVRSIRNRFKNVYHFSVVTYYRLFIASLFPQYEKILYLDCDLVVLGDISELYRIDLGDNILGAVQDQHVQNTEAFRLYADKAIGVDASSYINAGVLAINLVAFRRNNIEARFVELITGYDFDLLDPDQAYLNYLCRDRIHFLPNGWNKMPAPFACEGNKNIVHYALYKKPWQYDDVPDGEYFWRYAEKSPFLELIRERKQSFGPQQQAEKETMAREILTHALKIAASEDTFAKKLRRN